jgi:tetratricopeptide (TPR) repeat protein
LGRPAGPGAEVDGIKLTAMQQLANGLQDARRYDEALLIYEARLDELARHQCVDLDTRHAMANCLRSLGRHDEAKRMLRDVYTAHVAKDGKYHADTILAASNLTNLLVYLEEWTEAKKVALDILPAARRTLGVDHYNTMGIHWTYAMCLANPVDASLDDLIEAEAVLDDTSRRWRRVMGEAHPDTERIQNAHELARGNLASARAAANG